MSAAHTKGPWFSDQHGRIWRRDPAELYENGGGVAGDMPVAVAQVGWHGEGVRGYPMEANARLISAAPELLEALVDVMFRHVPFENKSEYAEKARAAIAKATGGAQ